MLNKKMLLSLLVIGVVSVTAGAGTWAAFSDTETSVSNSFTAGTLDLGLANSAGADPTGSVTQTVVTPTNWAPGDTYTSTLYVNNEGNIAASSLTVGFDFTATDGTPSSVDLPQDDVLDDMISATSVTFGGTHITALEGKTLAELEALSAEELGGLDANTEKALVIEWSFNLAADNGCQGDSASITLDFVAAQ